MTNLTRRLGAGAAALLASAAAAGALAVPAAAASADRAAVAPGKPAGQAKVDAKAQPKWIYLDAIKCNETEDWSQDEIRVEVNGKQQFFEYMDPGDKFTINEYMNGSTFTVKVIDLDSPDGDDVLGVRTVSRKNNGVLRFTSDGADYSVSYTINRS